MDCDSTSWAWPVAADVETLAGNHETAEHMLAETCDSYVAMGKPNGLYEALHALTQVDAGLPVDIERLAAMVDGAYVSTQALLHTALGAAHLVIGQLEEAEREARSAIGYFTTTDMLIFHANSTLVLGDVLRASGRVPEAADAYRQAFDLYRRKGSIVSVALAEARLASI